MYSFLLVGLGGAVGAMARYGVGRLVPIAGFPFATLIVNIVGSFLMGVLIAVLSRTLVAWSNEARLLLAVGVLGGFTTFSSFSLDVITLAQRGEWFAATGYILLSVVGSVGSLALALWLARGVI
ncbi:fluoride efflux transporter CrcB [Pelagibacterium limicola]|uniref:fluoride efflux transporter CrcB n=1 Tax=Pelagibacterium limicola TaxID=2791022 RepID=UPI0018AFB927|nr:fluoride efflux transporter CrcB [Pelagibacterium limicola]